MTEEKYCYIHKDTTTRLSCSSCGRPICPKCMISASVGYRCRECGKRNITHIEQVTPKQYIIGTLSGLIIGIGAGFIWNYLSNYGILINLLVAYAVGFCISKTIQKTIGSKIGLKIQILVGILTVICMIYNPIIIATNILSQTPLHLVVAAMTIYSFKNLINLLAVVIGVWAAIRHFKF